MKFIVLSFDDGLIDFKNNALPILNKYGVKATLNIITGYSDETKKHVDYECMKIEDVKSLNDEGHEIANHTDSHAEGGSYIECLNAKNKLDEWLNCKNKYGLVMPYSMSPNQSCEEYISQFKPLYVSYSHLNNNRYHISRFLLHVIYHFRKTTLSRLRYKVRTRMYKSNKNIKDGTYRFARLSIRKDINAKDLYKALSVMKNGYSISLEFHSILNGDQKCPYPNGAWQCSEFEYFLNLISKNKHYKIVTQTNSILQKYN